MSELETTAVSLAEDAEDLAAFEERAHELLVTYENLLKELKENGRL